MKSRVRAAKHAFYPSPEVAKALEGAAPKKLSARVNDLIMKGLSKEKEEAIRAEYERYEKELSDLPPRKKDSQGIGTTMLMSARLFDTDESDKDLF